MKVVRIDLADAKRNLIGTEKEKSGFIKKVIQFISSRSFSGCYLLEIKEIAYLNRKLRTAETKRRLKISLSKYFFGTSITDRFFPDAKALDSSLFDKVRSLKIEYRKKRFLYHCTPLDNLDDIISSGLKKMGGDHVFLSNSKYSLRFLFWKTKMNNTSMEFCILKINAKQLTKKHKLFYYLKNEIVTDYVESEYITVV